MLTPSLEFILRLGILITVVALIKNVFSLFYKSVNYKLVLSATLLTAPFYFYVVIAHNMLFGRISFYTVFLLVFTVSLFEYNIYIKRIYNKCSGIKLSTFIILSNIFSYTISEFIISYYL